MHVTGVAARKNDLIPGSACEETKDESCCKPFYQYTLHQSGVNCISLALQGKIWLTVFTSFLSQSSNPVVRLFPYNH